MDRVNLAAAALQHLGLSVVQRSKEQAQIVSTNAQKHDGHVLTVRQMKLQGKTGP